VDKIKNNEEKIALYAEEGIEDADVVVVTYGITSRVAMRAIRDAQKKGIKVGHLRLIVVWPFPESLIRRLSEKIKAFVVPEINLGQIVLEVERCSAGKCDVVSIQHAGGAVHNPQTMLDAIVEAAK
jgi:2-oxoglutarate ferredoxin oxidoreductase subunit alpha